MKHQEISEHQDIVNKICSGKDFTFPTIRSGYVVATKTLHKSANPSIFYDDIHRDVTIGMWTNPLGIKFVELGVVVQDFFDAVELGKRLDQEEIWDAKRKECISLKDFETN